MLRLPAVLIIFSVAFIPAVGMTHGGGEVMGGLERFDSDFTVSDILNKTFDLINSLRDVVALGTGILESLVNAWDSVNGWMMDNLGTSISEVIDIFMAALVGLLDLFVSIFGRVLAV